MVSGTEVLIGEDLFEGHSWTIGVVLLITIGVGLLCCVSAVLDPHLTTRNVHVTREPEVARKPSGMTLKNMRAKISDHGKERDRSFSWYYGDQLWQLMKIMNAQYCRGTLVQLLRRIAIMSEN